MLEALHCFEQAIALDPSLSPSYAGISYAFNLFGIYHELRPRDAFPRARDAADRALLLDPTDALALVMRAHSELWHAWDSSGAERKARRALELAPGLYLAHDCLGWTLAAQGRFDDAIASMQRARTLDPVSEYATYDLAWILILAGRWEQAMRELRPALVRHPQASELHRTFGFCLFYAGRVAEARTEFERVLELKPGDRWGSTNVVQALAALGQFDEARRLVRQLEDRASREPIPPLGIAIMHHWLGDDAAAITWLERSVEARDYWLVMLRFDPSMSRLRDTAGFKALLELVRAENAP
jgi:serine/threonine-protein kinase